MTKCKWKKEKKIEGHNFHVFSDFPFCMQVNMLAFLCCSGSSDNVSGGSLSEKIKPVHAAIPEKSNSINTDGGVPLYSDVNVVIPNFM